jgi:hypothetical protein
MSLRSIVSRNSDLLPAQRIVVRIRACGGCVPDDVRDGADTVLGGVFEAAGAVARPGTVVGEIASEGCGVGGEWEVFGF